MAGATVVGYFIIRAEFLALLGSILGALVLSALWIGRACIDGLTASIEVKGQPVLCGEPAKAVLRLQNRNRILPIYHPAVQIRESGRGGIRRFHYPGLLKAGERVERIVYPSLEHRGLQHLTVLRAFSRFPFGIAQTSAEQEVRSQDVLVWTKRATVEIATSATPSRLKAGFSNGKRAQSSSRLDAYLIRDYNEGDSQHSINWKLSAKLDKLMVIEPDLHPEPQYTFILDTWESLWMPLSYFERMLTLVAGLMHQMAVHQQASAIILNGKRYPLVTGKGYAAFMDALSLSAPIEEATAFEPREQRRYLRILPDGKKGITLQSLQPARAAIPR